MKGAHSVRTLCELLGVARSGYYRWEAGRPTARQQRDQLLALRIETAYRASRRTYGAPRLVRELRAGGTAIGRERCSRIMRDLGIAGRCWPHRRPRTTVSDSSKTPAPNRLSNRPPPSGPNQVWVCDITYVRTLHGWLFLAAVLDAWSRRVVGWSCADTLHTPLVSAALQGALRRRGAPAGLVHHSDQGCQYAERGYRETLQLAGIEQSMSRRGNCYDNALMESFWATLKRESALAAHTAPTRHDAELAIFDYIETFYNPTRRHSSLGFLSPVAFELNHQ